MREARQNAAHGFELEPQVRADLRACHAKHEFRARVAALFKALRERKEESRETLFGMHGTEKQHHAVLADDFARKHLEDVRAHAAHRGGRIFETVVRNHADFGVFERDNVARVHAARNAVKADHFARHVEVRDLLAAVAAHDGALQKAESNRIEIFKAVARTEKRLAAL